MNTTHTPQQIDLAFAPDMRGAVLSGRKHCTTRRKVKGTVGDFFPINGKKYRIIAIYPSTLCDVERLLYCAEGFISPAAFRFRWRELHNGTFNPGEQVYVHWFTAIQPEVQV